MQKGEVKQLGRTYHWTDFDKWTEFMNVRFSGTSHQFATSQSIHAMSEAVMESVMSCQ